jgi:hypothetical protein
VAYHHEKLGLRDFRVRVNLPSPIWQVRVPIRRVITPILGLLNPIRQVVPLISQSPLVSSTSSSSSSPISLFLVHNFTIIAEHKVKSSLSISPCHDHELTPSTAYTEYQYTPSTASTQDCLSSLHSHDYELTPECSISFRHSSLQHRPPPGSSP